VRPPEIGSFTSTSIGEFPIDRYRKRGRRRMIAEVATDYSIPDRADVTGRWARSD